MKVTFIGHSTLLIETPGAKIMTDPHFGMRMLWSARTTPPGMDIEALQGVDGILLSHGHLDHLDPRSLRRFGSKALLAVPPGLGWIGRRCVNGRCAVLKPWEDIRIGDTTVTATPVNHVNFRPGFIFGKATGYIINADGIRVFFAGDTSYFNGFGELGDRYDIDVAFLPIGPLRPAWFQRRYHMDPQQALKAFDKLKARYIVPIHWGGFRTLFDGDRDALNCFLKLISVNGYKKRSVILEPGQSAVFARFSNKSAGTRRAVLLRTITT